MGGGGTVEVEKRGVIHKIKQSSFSFLLNSRNFTQQEEYANKAYCRRDEFQLVAIVKDESRTIALCYKSLIYFRPI